MRRAFALILLLLAGVLLPNAEAISRPRTMTFEKSRAVPAAYVGQLYFNSDRTDYIGSGTVIRSRSVLTAGHNVYDPYGGFSTQVEFRRAAYGSSALTDVYATRLIVVGGYRTAADRYGAESVLSFAYDIGGLIFTNPLAAGKHANLTPGLNDQLYRVAIGYGAELHSGDYPLAVSPTSRHYQISGQYFENRSMAFEGGMSGGPLYVLTPKGIWAVAAVIVASSDAPEAGGVRLLDMPVATFIGKNLP